MSKPKKIRNAADKLMDNLISELKAQGDGEASFSVDPELQGNEIAGDAGPAEEAEHSRTQDASNDGANEGSTVQYPEGLDIKDIKSKTASHGQEDLSVTVPLTNEMSRDYAATHSTPTEGPSDRTQPAARSGVPTNREASVKVSFGVGRGPGRSPTSAAGQMSEAQMVQAEGLKIAQARILELETEILRLDKENQIFLDAAAKARENVESSEERLRQLERRSTDRLDEANRELQMSRESAREKSNELVKANKKIHELESRLQSDLKKIRVRERELENRLELARMEKTALIRAKDETILELSRKRDTLSEQIDEFKKKTHALQSKIDQQQEQLSRTVRALRMALGNLETSDSTGSSGSGSSSGSNSSSTSGQLVPIKKAE